jgi:3-dehydroquinate dehydratase II
MKILLINGPNLNFVGKREPEIYGSENFEDKLGEWKAEFPQIELVYFQSNHEGEIIDCIQKAYSEPFDGLIINGGAFSHYSYAIFDALRILTIPIIEVHLSNIFKRESFRHHSVLSAACMGMISGFGMKSYVLALEYFQLNNS